MSHAELDATDKKCPGSLDVCCQDPDWTPPPVVKEEELRDTTTTTTTTTTSTTTTTTTPRVEEDPPVQRKWIDISYSPSLFFKPYAPQCGQHNAWGLGVRISGYADGESQFGEWPHMCAILTMKKIGRNWINMYTCGGSLIAPGAVLTAAHCAKK